MLLSLTGVSRQQPLTSSADDDMNSDMAQDITAENRTVHTDVAAQHSTAQHSTAQPTISDKLCRTSFGPQALHAIGAILSDLK